MQWIAQTSSGTVHRPTDTDAGGCRDRLLKVFAIDQSTMRLVSTLSEHSGVVTAIRFARNSEQHQMIATGSTDKSVILRSIALSDDGQYHVSRCTTEILGGAVHSIASGVDSEGYDTALVVARHV
jgi:WD40 repeat protein